MGDSGTVQRIRMVDWNLHGAAKPRLDAVVELLQAHQPDVLVLQEVRRNQARKIAGLLRWGRSAWALKHNAYWPVWWRAEGLAVLSRHVLAPHPPVVVTDGPSRRSFRRRILLPVEVQPPDDRPFLVVDAHLSSESGDEHRRESEARRLVSIMPGGLPEVIAGDLNTDPSSPALQVIRDAGFVDGWDVAGVGDGFTSPANAPRRRIDYVLAREGARIVQTAVLDDLGAAMSGLSDHRPVLAVLEIEPDTSETSQ